MCAFVPMKEGLCGIILENRRFHNQPQNCAFEASQVSQGWGWFG